MTKKVVSKFGGTSMGDADCMRRSALVSAEAGACITVVSATSGTTNQLIEIGQAAEKGQEETVDRLIKTIRERHEKIGKDLQCWSQVEPEMLKLFEELESIAKGIFFLKDCSLKAMDTLMSLGERMSSVLFVYALKDAMKKKARTSEVEWLDARRVIITDDQFSRGKPLIDRIHIQCRNLLLSAIESGRKVYVTQGFIGRTEDGHTTTLGRGGSDYSAALFAEGIGAQVLEIWTDVAGIATTDPRICPQAQWLNEISFKEASELATFGAKVLHPATLLPAIRQNIPVFVGSSFDPQEKGTWVKREVHSQPLVRAMALRKKQSLVTLSTPEMLQAHGFLAKIFRVFDEHRVSIDAITTSEISVSMTVDQTITGNKKLISTLEEFADVTVEDNLCLVALIGNNINHTSGFAQRIFDSIPSINVRMICMGASKHNFCFLVSELDGDEALRKLHHTFIESAHAGI